MFHTSNNTDTPGTCFRVRNYIKSCLWGIKQQTHLSLPEQTHILKDQTLPAQFLANRDGLLVMAQSKRANLTKPVKIMSQSNFIPNSKELRNEGNTLQ